MKQFYGWIPNTIGRLSFSFAGTSNHPSPFISESNIRDGGRFFVCYQRRNLSDTTLPIPTNFTWLKRQIDTHIFEKNCDFQFIALMKRSEDESYIKGKIYIFERKDWKLIEAWFRSKMKEIFTLDKRESLDNFFEIESVSLKHSSVEFRLDRNGVYVTKICQINKDLIEEAKIKLSTQEHIICAQSYFFVRDIFHKHRFHAPSTDTILDVYANKENWKKSVNYALARKSIALRRQNTLESIEKSIGIVSYLEAFRNNIMTETERNKEPIFQIKTFLDSLKSGKNIAGIREEKSLKSHIEAYSDWLLAFIGILFTVSQLIQRDVLNIENSSLPIKWLFDMFQQKAAGTLIGLFAIVFLTKFSLLYKPNEKEDFAANIARLSLAYHRNTFPIVLFFIGMGLAILGILFLGFIFNEILSVK